MRRERVNHCNGYRPRRLISQVGDDDLNDSQTTLRQVPSLDSQTLPPGGPAILRRDHGGLHGRRVDPLTWPQATVPEALGVCRKTS